MKRRALVLAAIALLMVVAGAPSTASADIGIAVVPAKLEIKVDPGKTHEFNVRVYNADSESISVKVYAMDYAILPDNSFRFFRPGEKGYSAAKWVSVDHERFTLPPSVEGKRGFVDFKAAMRAPMRAEPGGHFAVLFFEFTGRKPAGSGVAPRGRVGSVLLVTVSGPIRRQGRIKNLVLPRISLTRDLPVEVDFENTGNVHVTTRGKVGFTDMFSGRPSGQLSFDEMTVLPGSVRENAGEWQGVPVLGLYRATALVEYGPDLFTFKTRERASGWVVVIWWPILLAFGLVVGGWGVFTMRRRRAVRRHPVLQRRKNGSPPSDGAADEDPSS